MATKITKTVGATGRDFSTWNAFMATIPADLVIVDEQWTGEGHDDAEFSITSGVAISFNVLRTTDATRYIEITAAAGKSYVDKIAPSTDAVKYYSTGKGVAIRVHTTSSTGQTISFTQNNKFTQIRRLMLKNEITREVLLLDQGTDSIVEQCILEQASGKQCIENNGASNVTFKNILCIFNTTTGSFDAIDLNFSLINVLNFVTVVRPDDIVIAGNGITTNRTDCELKNCAIFGFTTPTGGGSGSWVAGSDYNATDHATDVPGANSKKSVSFTQNTPWADSFAGSQNFRTLSGTVLDGGGIDIPAITVDLLGQTRPNPPYIGSSQDPLAANISRSIGSGGIIYSAGTAGGTAATAIVTFSGTLPTNIGEGDKLTLDVDGTPEVIYILTRDSDTQVTTQTNLVSTHTAQDFKIERAYSTMIAWESGQQGDLVLNNTIQKGVCYKDSVFQPGSDLFMDGSTTDATHHLWLSVAATERHTGKAGTGVILDLQNLDRAIDIRDPFTIIEWLEIKNFNDASFGCIVAVSGAGDHTIRNNIVHDGTGPGMRLTNSGNKVYNNIVYDASGDGIEYRGDAYNNTVYNCGGTGVLRSSGTTTATNNISMNNTVADFGGAITTQSNNISSDATATGTGSLINKLAANQFVNLVDGSEDFNLLSTSEAIEAGTDLNSIFTNDVIDNTRPATASGSAFDMGAFHALTVTKTVKSSGGDYTSLSGFEAGEQADLTLQNRIRRALCFALVDTATVFIIGWTTDSTRYVVVENNDDPKGVFNSSMYHIDIADGTALNIAEAFTRVIKIQAKVSHSATASGELKNFQANQAGVLFDRCIATIGSVDPLSSANARGFVTEQSDAANKIVMVNCLAYDLGLAKGSFSAGFYSNVPNEAVMYYCNAYQCGWRGYSGTTGMLMKNCIADGNITDYSANLTTCLSSDATGSTGLINKNPTYQDEAGKDFHSVIGSDGENLGTDLSADSVFAVSTDVDGTTRTATPDVGFNEFVVDVVGGGIASIQAIHTVHRRRVTFEI